MMILGLEKAHMEGMLLSVLLVVSEKEARLAYHPKQEKALFFKLHMSPEHIKLTYST